MDKVNSNQKIICSDFESRLGINVIIIFLYFFQMKIAKNRNNTNFEARMEIKYIWTNITKKNGKFDDIIEIYRLGPRLGKYESRLEKKKISKL